MFIHISSLSEARCSKDSDKCFLYVRHRSKAYILVCIADIIGLQKISWKEEPAYKAESRKNTFYIDKYRTEYKASYEKYRY